MSVDLDTVLRTATLDEISEAEALAELAAGRAVVLTATHFCGCGIADCPRCAGEHIHGYTARWLIRPEEMTLPKAIAYWHKHETRPYRIGRTQHI